MTATKKNHEVRLGVRLRKARLELKEQELKFFPKTNSMPDHPKYQWVRASAIPYQSKHRD